MTDVTIDPDNIRKVLWKAAHQIDPRIEQIHDYVSEWMEKRLIPTPAMAVPMEDVIYLHGKIPESDIEMVLTHEMLHLAIQRVLGLNDIKGKPKDGVVDNPTFNALLCLMFDIQPLKMFKWLHKASGNSIGEKLWYLIIFQILKGRYKDIIERARKLWE